MCSRSRCRRSGCRGWALPCVNCSRPKTTIPASRDSTCRRPTLIRPIGHCGGRGFGETNTLPSASAVTRRRSSREPIIRKAATPCRSITEDGKYRTELPSYQAESLLRNGIQAEELGNLAIPADLLARAIDCIDDQVLQAVVVVCFTRYAVESSTDRLTLDTTSRPRTANAIGPMCSK
jgi:hypothetical protein